MTPTLGHLERTCRLDSGAGSTNPLRPQARARSAGTPESSSYVPGRPVADGDDGAGPSHIRGMEAGGSRPGGVAGLARFRLEAAANGMEALRSGSVESQLRFTARRGVQNQEPQVISGDGVDAEVA